jgi:hypothetical protein
MHATQTFRVADPNRSRTMSQHYHNKGQMDASKGGYEPPYGFLHELIFGMSKRELSEAKAYRKGWREGKRKKA